MSHRKKKLIQSEGSRVRRYQVECAGVSEMGLVQTERKVLQFSLWNFTGT